MARPEQVDHGHWHGKRVRIRPDLMLGKLAESWVMDGESDYHYTQEDVDTLTAFVREKGYEPGTVAKCVMVSRMGDCGLTKRLDAENGYDIRVPPEALEEVTPPSDSNDTGAIGND